MKGILQNVGTQSYLGVGQSDDIGNAPAVLCSSSGEAAKIQIMQIGKDPDPIAILHTCDTDGSTKILDFADTTTGCFTALRGSTYPKNQQFSMQKLDGDKFKLKLLEGAEKYLTVQKQGESGKELLVLWPLETDKGNTELQEFILRSIPVAAQAATTNPSATTTATAQAKKKKSCIVS